MIVRIALAFAMVTAFGGVLPGAGHQNSAADSVSLVGVYPNPATERDVGEYVVLDSDIETSLAGYAITDGEDTVSLPNATIDGRVAITDDSRIASRLGNETTIVVPEGLALSNAGERVDLLRDGEILSSLEYDRAPTAEVWNGDVWEPLGATDVPVASASSVPATVFALPDDPSVPLERLEAAEHRIALAGYTLTSMRIADALVDAQERGVLVAVLVDDSPVGGTSSRQIEMLEKLTDAGIEVSVSGGPRGRYQFHHAKYAVVDDAVLVTSENWKPAGVGGNASRGWGVVLEDHRLAEHLAGVFAADADWVDGRSWSGHDTVGQPDDPATGSYPTRFQASSNVVDDARIIVAPDNAEAELLELIDGANDSILVQQVSVENNGPLLEAVIGAARRGVTVRILLGSAWYVEEENAALANDLTHLAAAEDLPLAVELVEPRSRFDHLHVKGLVVDERHVVVGSINWNPTALRENREVAVVLTDDEVGRYFARLFRADWRGAAWRVHWTTLGGLLVAVLAAIGVGGRFEFDPPAG
ncbi:MAG: phosphatidylserine/phosphatidylglycerophosphate/cardiolipin synthase family protein [Halanaeroarchaeum sp.]